MRTKDIKLIIDKDLDRNKDIDENLLVINRRINEYKECAGCNVNL